MMKFAGLFVAGSILLGALPAMAEGDPEKGARAFNKCKACHVLKEGQNRVGPSLYGLWGREAGGVEGFRYSKALQDSTVVWNEESLDPYLKDPASYIAGNRMGQLFRQGVKNDQERADLIAYLKQETGGE